MHFCSALVLISEDSREGEQVFTMSDDPSAFLRASKTQEIMEQTRMFDSKKWLWVPDEEEGFKAANIISQKGDRCVLELSDGSVSLSCR